MYILTRISGNDFRSPVMVSDRKKKLVSYIREDGFYWSNKCKRYIDDRTSRLDGGSGIDYLITKINVI